MCAALAGCTAGSGNFTGEAEKGLGYCAGQRERTLAQISPAGCMMSPKNIAPGDSTWNLYPVSKELWTEGFWPGILWYDYEYTGDSKILEAVEKYTEALGFLSGIPAYDHDLGFIIFCSYGNGYRLTGKEEYRMLSSLYENYRGGDRCPAFLIHSTGHRPAGTEIDYAIIYADYYYIEALLRLKNKKI